MLWCGSTWCECQVPQPQAPWGGAPWRSGLLCARTRGEAKLQGDCHVSHVSVPCRYFPSSKHWISNNIHWIFTNMLSDGCPFTRKCLDVLNARWYAEVNYIGYVATSICSVQKRRCQSMDRYCVWYCMIRMWFLKGLLFECSSTRFVSSSVKHLEGSLLTLAHRVGVMSKVKIY